MKRSLFAALVKAAAKLYYRVCFGKKRKLKYIPASGKVLGEEELLAMIDASLDMWLTAGRFNEKFEKGFAHLLGAPYALTVNSGSSANLLALSALTSHALRERRLNRGDEVITAAAAFPTTVNPIIQLGLIPVFIDCEIGTYNIDAAKIETAVTPKTKAVIFAHTLGNVADLKAVKAVCEKHNLWFIEDSCDALGALYGDKFTGTVGDIGTYSFYPAHIITMGEGGAVVANNPKLHAILRSFRDWGRDCWCETGRDNSCGKRFSRKLGALPLGYDHKYTYSHLGYNLKITDWQAAIGLAQLEKMRAFVEKRRKNFYYLYEKLKGLERYLILPKVLEGTAPAPFGFAVSVKEGLNFTKRELVEYLEKNGVGTRELFAGNILRQPLFTENNFPLRVGGSPLLSSNGLTEEHYKELKNSDFVMNSTFWVGVYPELEEEHLNKIAKTIDTFVSSYPIKKE